MNDAGVRFSQWSVFGSVGHCRELLTIMKLYLYFREVQLLSKRVTVSVSHLISEYIFSGSKLSYMNAK